MTAQSGSGATNAVDGLMPSEPFLIRPAVVSDAPALLRIYPELDEPHKAARPEFFPETITRNLETVEGAIADPKTGIFVAEFTPGDPESIGGFIRVLDVQTPDNGVLLSRRFGLVDDVVVLPAHRRTGVASALLGAAEGWARTRGLPALEVTVWTFNQGARELYVKEGFWSFREYLRKELGG